MPFYKFRCTVCGHEFEDFQGVNDANPPCPSDAVPPDPIVGQWCGGETVKVPSVPGPPQGGPTPRFYR